MARSKDEVTKCGGLSGLVPSSGGLLGAKSKVETSKLLRGSLSVGGGPWRVMTMQSKRERREKNSHSLPRVHRHLAHLDMPDIAVAQATAN